MPGEAMQKAQDLQIKHLYVTGEDQPSSPTTSSSDILPEITINEINAHDNSGWSRN